MHACKQGQWTQDTWWGGDMWQGVDRLEEVQWEEKEMYVVVYVIL